ncbi:MAG: hypothetical protein RLZZ400_989 [Actinomycetota bacterium]|jgi:RimJ/RimL family protein N-acetyltransferase
MQLAQLLAKSSDATVRLVQLSAKHLEPYLEMVSNPEARRLTATTQSFTREQIQDWLSTRAETPNRRDWAIIDASGEFVGEVVLNEFNDSKNEMNLRIALRGPKYYNLGYGRQAIALALVHAFDDLFLDRVTISALVDNRRAQASYESVGFVAGRQYNDKGLRFQRMSVNKWQFVYALGEAGLKKYLNSFTRRWQFDFDNGKRRAGLCNYTDRKITISKYLVGIHSVDESLQVLAHEIAHALCGPNEGHGKVWKATAKQLGYRHEKFSGNEIAKEKAPWVGHCPKGHEHYRYRRPTRVLSCAICSRSYSDAHRIVWQKVTELKGNY